MTILLTGGTGKTASRVAKLLRASHPEIDVLLTSRKGQEGVPKPFKGVVFDWADKTTYTNPFNADPNIDRIYLVGPIGTGDGEWVMKAFIDLAIERGVKRVVLLSATGFEKGSFHLGRVHEYLTTLGDKITYSVLRPSWFFDNFLTFLRSGIRDENIIITATGDAKIGFISTDDIAEVAAEALFESTNSEKDIVGPELLSYSEVAQTLTDILGRKIIHKNVSFEERVAVWESKGMNRAYAKRMTGQEIGVAEGLEERIYQSENRVLGKVYLRDFLSANKDAWN